MKMTHLSIEELNNINGGGKTTDIVGDLLKIAGGVVLTVGSSSMGPAGIATASMGVISFLEGVNDLSKKIKEY